MTGNTFVDIVIAVAFGYLIWRVSIAMIRMMSTTPPEIDPDDIEPVDQDYRCTAGSLSSFCDSTEFECSPHRHCRRPSRRVCKDTQAFRRELRHQAISLNSIPRLLNYGIR
jgi:hypothetical protein